MSSFTKPLIVKHLDGVKWELIEEFDYHIGAESSDEIITVPAGFITDFASIPQLFWSLIGHPTGKYGKAAVIHDFLYKYYLYCRKECDQIFEEGMKVLGISWWKRKWMYWSVRAFAWIAWNKYRKLEVTND